MEYSEYDIFKIKNYEDLKSLIEETYFAGGNFNDRYSDAYKKNIELYKEFYNQIAVNILIKKLKFNESEARKIHKKVWKKLDFINYPINNKCFITEYINELISNADKRIAEAETQKIKTGNRLSELCTDNLCENIESDKHKLYKEQCNFIWSYIDNMDKQSKKVFLYKLYGELSFEEISQIMNIDVDELIKIYNQAEDKIFSDKKFRKFFK